MSIAGIGYIKQTYEYNLSVKQKSKEITEETKSIVKTNDYRSITQKKEKEKGSQKSDKLQVTEGEETKEINVGRGRKLADRVSGKSKAPYSILADENNQIIYNGVVFYCDDRTNSICLGDMTQEDNILNIPLSKGGCLKVNRDNIGDLSKAIDMFSPEDINLIMRAITLDNKLQQMKMKIEEDENGIGEEAESTIGDTVSEANQTTNSEKLEQASDPTQVSPTQLAESVDNHSLKKQAKALFGQLPDSIWQAWLESWLETMEDDKKKNSQSVYGSIDFKQENYLSQVQEKVLVGNTEGKYENVFGSSVESVKTFVQEALLQLDQKKNQTQYLEQCR